MHYIDPTTYSVRYFRAQPEIWRRHRHLMLTEAMKMPGSSVLSLNRIGNLPGLIGISTLSMFRSSSGLRQRIRKKTLHNLHTYLLSVGVRSTASSRVYSLRSCTQGPFHRSRQILRYRSWSEMAQNRFYNHAPPTCLTLCASNGRGMSSTQKG